MKQFRFNYFVDSILSLPVRERGLKLGLMGIDVKARKSLPVRERGLKQDARHYRPGSRAVAPRAGAWIETERIADAEAAKAAVAPRAGAWIETISMYKP